MIARASTFPGPGRPDATTQKHLLQTTVFGVTIPRMADGAKEPISIVLSPSQVEAVVRAAQDNGVPTVSSLIASALTRSPEAAREGGDADGGSASDTMEEAGTDRRLSRSLLRGLSIMTCFAPERSERGIVEIARELGMSASTTHRYALTLVEMGLLERCPRTRKYRLTAGA